MALIIDKNNVKRTHALGYNFEARVDADSGTVDNITQIEEGVKEVSQSGSTPSLTLLPIAFNEGDATPTNGKLYSIIPSDSSGDFTVTGGGNAVSQRSDGYYQINWSVNTPRFKWNDGVPAVLVEEQRQNLITYPRSFSNAYWTKSGATIEGDPTTVGAEKFTGFTSLGTGWTQPSPLVYQSNSTSGNNAVSQTVFTSSQLGKLFRFSFRIVDHTSGALFLRATGFNGVLQTLAISGTSTGIYTLYVVAESTSQILELVTGISGWVGIIDQISLKEVQGFSCPFVDSSGVNTLEGFKLVEDGSTGSHSIVTYIPVTTGNTYTYFVLAKKGENNYLRLTDGNFNILGLRAYFNLNTGVVETNEYGTAKIDEVINGWYLCSISNTAIATGTQEFRIRTSKADSTESYTGDGTSGIYICHAQLEQAATASSPIYGTEGSALTRLADYIITTQGGILQSILNNGFTLFAEFQNIETIRSSINTLIGIGEHAAGVGGKGIGIGIIGSTKQVRAEIAEKSTNRQLLGTSNNAVIGKNKIAVRYNPNGSLFAIFLNGIKTEIAITPFAEFEEPVSDDVIIGIYPLWRAIFEIEQFFIVSNPLTDNQIEDLTTL